MDSHNHVKFRVNVIAVSVKDKMTNFKVIRSEIEWTPHIVPAITQGRIIVIIASINKSYIWYSMAYSVGQISEEVAQEALLELVSRTRCYGTSAAREMDIYRIVPSCALHVSSWPNIRHFNVFIRSLIFSHLRANQMIIY